MSNTHYQLKVRNIISETDQAIVVEFEHPEEKPLAYQSGQFLTLLLNIEGEAIRRAYSLCTSPLVDEFPAITVKRVEGGKVSNYLNDQLKAGDTLEVIEAQGMFTANYDDQQKKHKILIGGGSGITPLMSILKTSLHQESNSIISLIYANQNNNSIIFKKQLEDIQAQYADRVKIVNVLEKAPLLWSKGYKGRIDTKLLKKILSSLPSLPSEQTEYYMCGPSGMMNQVELSFQELGLPLGSLRKESFGVSPQEAAEKRASVIAKSEDEGLVAKTYTVKVIYAGDEFTFDVPPDQTILQTALKQDIDLPFSCQSGMCTACMGRCVSGKVVLDEEDALTPKELDQGYVLTCVGHPMSEGVVIEID